MIIKKTVIALCGLCIICSTCAEETKTQSKLNNIIVKCNDLAQKEKQTKGEISPDDLFVKALCTGGGYSYTKSTEKAKLLLKKACNKGSSKACNFVNFIKKTNSNTQ